MGFGGEHRTIGMLCVRFSRHFFSNHRYQLQHPQFPQESLIGTIGTSYNVHKFHRNRYLEPPGPDFLKTGTVYPVHKIHNSGFEYFNEGVQVNDS